MKNKIYIGVTVAVAIMLMFSFTAKAELSFWDKVAGLYTQLLYDDTKDEVIDQISDVPKLSAWPGDTLGEKMCFGELCKWYKSGACFTASTTLFSVKNPFNATSTVSLSSFQITESASSSIMMEVGTSTTATVGFATKYDSGVLVDGVTIATSTNATIIGKDTLDALGSGELDPGTISVERIVIGPAEYVVGYASTTYACDDENCDPGLNPDPAGITGLGATSTMKCYYNLEFTEI